MHLIVSIPGKEPQAGASDIIMSLWHVFSHFGFFGVEFMISSNSDSAAISI